MLKENYFNLLVLFFIGILVIYIINTPPFVIVKLPKIDNLQNVHYLLDNNNLSHMEFCNNY